jgi:hypothetical protein
LLVLARVPKSTGGLGEGRHRPRLKRLHVGHPTLEQKFHQVPEIIVCPKNRFAVFLALRF